MGSSTATGSVAQEWLPVAPHGPSGTIFLHRLGASRERVEKLADGPATLVTIAELVGFPPGLGLIERSVRTPSDRVER
jgi:hypothetical protein